MESTGRATGGGSAKDGLGPGHGGVNYKANLSEINGLLTAERGRSNAERQRRAWQESVPRGGNRGRRRWWPLGTPEGLPESGSAEEGP